MKKDLLELDKHFEIPEIANSEVAVFVKRLIGIFEILMMKLELTTVLPLISSNVDVLKALDHEDSKRIVTFFSQFISGREDSGLSHSKDTLRTVDTEISDSPEQTDDNHDMSNISFNKSSCSCGSIKDRTDVHDLLQIMLSYPMMHQLSKNLKFEMTKSNNFLRQIKYFMEFVISKTLSMPTEEREKELNFHELCAQIEHSKLEISDLTVSLEEHKTRQRMEAQQLSNKLDNLLDQWQKIDEEYNSNLTQLLKNSKENKAKSLDEFTERINYHQSLFDKLKSQLESDKTNNKKIEHEIQKQKFKVESQLTSLIMKFDTEIGDRQETYDNLMKEYDDLEQEKSQLMDDMNEQFIIYNSIIKEREEKEFEEYREKYMKFVTNRSAKLIQRWWRNIRLKLKKKKDKKKGKKKKAK